MNFYYNKQDGKVGMVSEGEIKADSFAVLAHEPTEQEKEWMQQNYDMVVEKGSLKIKPSERILEQEKARKAEQTKQALMAKSNPRIADIIEFLRLVNI
jgi:uncharacterized protein YwqG